MARAYYNEIDPAAAHILRAMIDADVIAPGDVDTRSIKDIHPDDLSAYTQCHFFAGGGFWSVAARLAGWPDDRELWTGSCPCQPFSAAGKGLGTDDPRHLWPDFFRLIRARRPALVMGEQVAGAAGYGWFDGVRADLARENYASRAVDFPAGAVDAPHQRNRLYWAAVGSPTAPVERQHPRERRIEAGGSIGDGRHVVQDDASGLGERQSHEPICSGRSSADLADAGRVGQADDVRNRHPSLAGDHSENRGNQEGKGRPEHGPAVPRRHNEGHGGHTRHVDQVDAAGIGRGEGRAEPSLFGGWAAASSADASSVTQGDAERSGLEGQPGYGHGGRRQEPNRPTAEADVASAAKRVAQGHASVEGREGQPIAQRLEGASAGWPDVERTDRGDGRFGAVAQGDGNAGRELQPEGSFSDFGRWHRDPDAGRNGTYWSDAEWIMCHDGKARRAKPGLRLLVDGLPGRVDLWRVGGNAIVPEAAAEVIAAFMDVYGLPERRRA